MRYTLRATSILIPLLLTAIAPLMFAQEVEYNWTNGEGNNSWYDPGNWGIDDDTTPNATNAIVNIGAGPGNVVFGAGSATSGATVLSMNVGAGAGLEIVSGFIGFSERTPARQFSLQNSGAIDVTGDTASLRLKDEAHNFSSAVIRLNNGGKIDINNGHATLNTSDLNTGNGTVILDSDSGEPDSEITGSGGAIFTLQQQTVSGTGNIGTNSIGLVFGSDTIVDANKAGRVLTVDAADGLGTVNEGVMRATVGGILNVRGAVNNTSGLIEAENGSAVTLSDTFDITGGILRRSGTGTFSSSGSGRLADLTLDGTVLSVENAANLELEGTINNLGDIAITNFNNNATDLQIDDSVVLTGGGTITLGGVNSFASRIADDDGGGVLTNVDNTIRGKGVVGNGQVQINNEVGGTIDANESGTLTLGPVAGTAFKNRGLLTASNAGNLVFGSGEYDNVGGMINIQDDSTITLNSGSNITGGTVQNLGTGTIDMNNTGSFTDLTTVGTITVNNADNLTLVGTINNLGDIAVTNFNNNATDLQIDDSVVLTGGGTVTLGGVNSFASRITDDDGGGVLTNVDNTIRGKGVVGNGQVQINNEVGGTIDANAGSLTLGPVAGSAFKNRGLLSASNGGNLVFGSGEHDNVGGTISIQDDDSGITLNSGSNITGGTVQNLGTGIFDMSNTGSFTDLTTVGTITVNNADNLKLTGTINNLGDIAVTNFNNNATDIQIDTAATLTGGGTVTLDGVNSFASRITDDTPGGVLTNVDNTIRGKGIVGNSAIQIINEAGGTIDGNDSSGTLSLGGISTATSINRGLITASNGGQLIITAGEFDNSDGLVESQSGSSVTVGGTSVIAGGLLNAADDSTINFSGTGKVVDATLQSSGSGKYEAIAGTAVLENVINESGVTVRDAANLELVGAINNLGDIAVMNANNNSTDLQVGDSVVLTGGGTVTLGGVNSFASRITDDGIVGVLTNVDNTIRGKGVVGNGAVQINNEVGGTIDANDATGALTVGPVSGTALKNRGLLTASNGGNLVLGSGEYDNVGGTIDIQDDSTITLNSGSNITGGTVQSLGTGVLDMNNTGSFSDLTTAGTITVNNADNLKLTGTINNLGDIAVTNFNNNATDIQIDIAASLTGGGTVTLGGVNSFASRITDDTPGGVLTNVDNTIRGKGRVGTDSVDIENLVLGTIQSDAGSTLLVDSAAATFDNFGTLSAINNSLLEVRDITNNHGIVDAQFGSRVEFETLVNAMSGQLVGNGVIEAANEIVNNGTISPGNSPGILTLDTNLELGASSNLEIELASIGMFDELIVNGDVELGGALELVLLDGYRPGETDVFDVVMADAISGFFANVSDGSRLLTTDGMGSFQVNYGSGGTVQLSQFSAVPEPGATTVLVAACFGLLLRRRKEIGVCSGGRRRSGCA